MSKSPNCTDKYCNPRGFLVQLLGGNVAVDFCPTCWPERMQDEPDLYYTPEQAKDRVDRAVKSHRATIDEIRAELAAKDAEIERLQADYFDLLYQVDEKHPDETRHETAKRWLAERREMPCNLSESEQSND